MFFDPKLNLFKSDAYIFMQQSQVEVKAENDFDNQVRKDLVGTVKSIAAGNPAEAAQVLKRFIEVAGDVAKFTEQQKTVRKDIEAKRDSDIARIQAQKEIIMIYLEKSFDERKENFSKLFQVITVYIINSSPLIPFKSSPLVPLKSSQLDTLKKLYPKI